MEGGRKEGRKEGEEEAGCNEPKVQKSIWHRQVLQSMWRRVRDLVGWWVGVCLGGWVDECWGVMKTGCHDGMGERAVRRGGAVVELVWEESREI